jgi:hypothetical protein
MVPGLSASPSPGERQWDGVIFQTSANHFPFGGFGGPCPMVFPEPTKSVLLNTQTVPGWRGAKHSEAWPRTRSDCRRCGESTGGRRCGGPDVGLVATLDRVATDDPHFVVVDLVSGEVPAFPVLRVVEGVELEVRVRLLEEPVRAVYAAASCLA